LLLLDFFKNKGTSGFTVGEASLFGGLGGYSLHCNYEEKQEW
jgi:hypothetical protein